LKNKASRSDNRMVDYRACFQRRTGFPPVAMWQMGCDCTLVSCRQYDLHPGALVNPVDLDQSPKRKIGQGIFRIVLDAIPTILIREFSNHLRASIQGSRPA